MKPISGKNIPISRVFTITFRIIETIEIRYVLEDKEFTASGS